MGDAICPLCGTRFPGPLVGPDGCMMCRPERAGTQNAHDGAVDAVQHEARGGCPPTALPSRRLRVLDLFCGTWGFSAGFAARGDVIVGVDLDHHSHEDAPPEDEDGFWAWVEREDWHENHFWKREVQAWVFRGDPGAGTTSLEGSL